MKKRGKEKGNGEEDRTEERGRDRGGGNRRGEQDSGNGW
jgi:hypothetical protein